MTRDKTSPPPVPHGAQAARGFPVGGMPGDILNVRRYETAKALLKGFNIVRKHWQSKSAASAPELNILVDLYLREQEGRSVSVGDACLASGSPHTTALRSVEVLIRDGRLFRYVDPADNRRKLLGLTALARNELHQFLDEFAGLVA